mgnify:CR=1 FL=1
MSKGTFAGKSTTCTRDVTKDYFYLKLSNLLQHYPTFSFTVLINFFFFFLTAFGFIYLFLKQGETKLDWVISWFGLEKQGPKDSCPPEGRNAVVCFSCYLIEKSTIPVAKSVRALESQITCW